MNIAVVGLGSMGKRRIRLTKEIDPKIKIYGVDNNKDRQIETSKLYDIETYNSLDDISIDITAVFVCTSPLSHATIISQCLKRNCHVFSEINLVDDMYDENVALAKSNNKVLFLSSTPLYKNEMQYIKKYFSNKHNINYIYHIGQYLPDWHPWESYNNFFVGDKRTNGCREIMAIEFPWLINTFGEVLKYNVFKSKITSLNIDYNDNYMLQFEHVNGIKGSIVIDVVSPKAVRKFEAYSEGKYISWDGTPDSLYVYDHTNKENINVQLYSQVDHKSGYSDFVIENAYRDEIDAFLNAINGDKSKCLYSFEKDKDIICLINKIEG